MDRQKKDNVTKWGTEIIATAGVLEVRDNGIGDSEIIFVGEPSSIPIESAGVLQATIETKAQFQRLLAATMYERAQKLIQAATELMRQAAISKE